VIRDHEVNCRWGGGRVGILVDPDFFTQPEAVRRQMLAPYRWVEFRRSVEKVADPWLLSNAGFAQVDTQLRFRVGLKRMRPRPDSDSPLPVRFATDGTFALPEGQWPLFLHERFRHLPGATPEKIAERYAIWARALLAKSPEWCVEIGPPADPQGWFFAEAEGEHLHLALALLGPGATVSGFDLYAAALAAFARRGARIGEARFSIENRPVHNIYARLGAVFLDAIGCWLWVAR
jgi:hypothetical protein